MIASMYWEPLCRMSVQGGTDTALKLHMLHSSVGLRSPRFRPSLTANFVHSNPKPQICCTGSQFVITFVEDYSALAWREASLAALHTCKPTKHTAAECAE
eukprot:3304618-Amphidinium_carterae.1